MLELFSSYRATHQACTSGCWIYKNARASFWRQSSGQLYKTRASRPALPEFSTSRRLSRYRIHGRWLIPVLSRIDLSIRRPVEKYRDMRKWKIMAINAYHAGEWCRSNHSRVNLDPSRPYKPGSKKNKQRHKTHWRRLEDRAHSSLAHCLGAVLLGWSRVGRLF